MKVAVTGGMGFVGSHTVAALVRSGHQVRLLVRSADRVAPALEPLGVRDVDVALGDVTDREAVERALDSCEPVVHCASVYSFDPRMDAAIRKTNVAGTELVLEIASHLGLNPIIHVSTYLALIAEKGTILTATAPSPMIVAATVDRASPETATTWMHACRRRPTSVGKESPMIAIWRMGPIAAAAALRGLGFSSQEANRLVELKLRCERGDLDDPTDTQKRLRFVRWLVQNGRLSEGEPVCWADGQRRAARGRR